MKKLFSLLLIAILVYSCTSEDNTINVCDTPNCITDVPSLDVFGKDTDIIDTGTIDAEDKTLCSQGELLNLQSVEVVADAEIDFMFGKVSIEKIGTSEKTQFDVILKGSKTKSDSNGEFVVEITKEDLNKLPDNFEILFEVTPPEGFMKEVKVNKNIVPFFKYPDNTKFSFVLSYSNGYFVISLKDQIYKLTTKNGGKKEALDAFISATTKAIIADGAEPVPGAEIIIDKPLVDPSKKKDKKKSLFFSESGKEEDIVVTCYEFEVGDEIVVVSNNEGYFSFKSESTTKPNYILLTIKPDKDFKYIYDAASMLIDMPEAEDGIYDLMLTFEKGEADKGRFIIVGPILFQPCSTLTNPVCEPKKCKMIGGQIGKCQYLYDEANNRYECGCYYEVCKHDCIGNCKTPSGKEGVCHIEEITVTYNQTVITNKRCVCGPVSLECNKECQTNQDCVSYTGGQLPICATDMFGNNFCTKACNSSSDCPSPFSMCAKMGPDNRGICICPCSHADNIQTQCNPIGLYNQQCNNITYGSLTDCLDINNDGNGECSLCCKEDGDCPKGLHCYDLPTPLNEKCTRACMCKEPPAPNLCKECSNNNDCAPNQTCIDDDNNPNTPTVCTVPCGPMGVCPNNPVFTYCDYNISKYCICRHPIVSVDCNYVCKDNQDCIVNSQGQFDLCMPDINGIKRCTKSCSDAKECPSPYSMCIKFGDKSYCACPCIHFDSDNVSCNQYGFNIPECIDKTNNSLPDCFDVDNDGSGECTHCCNSNKDCPESMICTSTTNAKCDKVCTCKEHPVADVCQKCSQDSDCPAGFVCADDDNNNLTPNVCTRVCPSIYPCPTTPVYSYCDNNISKYCICNQSGVNLCETKCEKNSDCPAGLICADDDNNPLTPKICTKTCGDCPDPMICNNNANLPVAVCMCPRDYCKSCQDDSECSYGLKCIDSDSDSLTPNVCTKTCGSDYECPLNLSCNLNTKSCDCNRCSKWSNEKCEPLTCYYNGQFGKCMFIKERCDCYTGGGGLEICKECKSDLECQSPLKCVDADNNPLTPNVCSEPCPQNGCPSPAICDYNISKYCFCN